MTAEEILFEAEMSMEKSVDYMVHEFSGVRTGMTFLGVDIFAKQIVFGVVLILAVAITIDRTKVLIVK